MDKIVEKILEIEQRAQALCADAVSQKEHFHDTLEEEVRRMEKNIREHANKRVRLIYQKQQEFTSEQIKEIRARYRQQEKQLSLQYEQNHSAWEEEIFSWITAQKETGSERAQADEMAVLTDN